MLKYVYVLHKYVFQENMLWFIWVFGPYWKNNAQEKTHEIYSTKKILKNPQRTLDLFIHLMDFGRSMFT